MSHFIYSINATIPIFLVIIGGYLLNRKGMLGKEFVSAANKFNFTVTLPALLFRDIASADFMKVFDWRYIIFCMIVTSVSFWSIWGLTRYFMKDKSMIGAFVQASFRSSAAVLGIAFIQNIYGDSGMVSLMIIGTVPLYNIYSVIVLTFESENKEGKNIKNTFINICKNPVIIAILAGLVVSASGLYSHCPEIISKTINNFAVMASPLALIVIGAGFEGKSAASKIKPAVTAVVIKLILLPAIFLPIAVSMGFREQGLAAILIMSGSPTTPTCYIMAKNMGNDGVLTTSVVVLATLFSSVTLTLWIFALRNMGML